MVWTDASGGRPPTRRVASRAVSAEIRGGSESPRPADDAEDDPRRPQRRVDPDALTLAQVRLGRIAPDDLSIRRETLLAQAARAEAGGYPQLARNFRRAAEMTALPNDVLLAAYEKLRPYRATYYELLALSQEIAARYDAPETGAYIREAAEACRDKGLLKPDDG